MTLKKVEFNFNPQLFERAGVDVHNPKLKEKVEERNELMDRKFENELKHKQADATWSKSLWASGEIKFTFNDWKPDQHANQAKARSLGNKAYKLARAMEHGHLNVIMSGNAGVGKTSLALAMLDMLQKAGKTVLFVSTVALSQLMSDQYEYKDRKQQLHYLTRAMKTCDVLLLDDLGADGGNVEKVMGKGYTGTRKDLQTLLFEIVNTRYEGTKKEQRIADENHVKLIKPVHQTIVTTNNLTDELIRIYGERTISRLVTRDPNHRLAFNDMEDMRTKEGI